MRRAFFPLILILVLEPLRGAEPFNFQALREMAMQLGKRPYVAATNSLPAALEHLTYGQYKAISFKSDHALWKEERLPFEIEFMHPGWVYKDWIAIHVVDENGIRDVPFDPNSFDYGTNRFETSTGMGYAGFRINHPVDHFGEVAVFLGASYFRMIGRDQTYGISARGVAVDSGLEQPEEFPIFKEFWLVKPSRTAASLRLFALLDGPSVAGAYEFKILPGRVTTTHVDAAVFIRKEAKRFGFSPLTSMFLHDENSHRAFGDFRPNVHDSDGLLMHNGRDEWIWRPLEAGVMMRINAYMDENPKGFGLLQRDRNFEHYQDLVAHFEARPTLWVTPLSKWGRGAVQLIQWPSDVEFTDNVGAFWVPDPAPKAGDRVELSYDLSWTRQEITPAHLGHVRSTRIGRVTEQPPRIPPNLRFVIDFDGPSLQQLTAANPLDAEVHYGEGTKFVADTVLKNPVNGTWRLVFEITNPTKAVDLSALLKRAGKPVTETWNFTWQP